MTSQPRKMEEDEENEEEEEAELRIPVSFDFGFGDHGIGTARETLGVGTVDPFSAVDMLRSL